MHFLRGLLFTWIASRKALRCPTNESTYPNATSLGDEKYRGVVLESLIIRDSSVTEKQLKSHDSYETLISINRSVVDLAMGNLSISNLFKILLYYLCA